MGPSPREQHLYEPVRVNLHRILLLANHHTPVIRTATSTAIIGVFPFACDLHQRRQIVHTYRRYTVGEDGQRSVPSDSLASGQWWFRFCHLGDPMLTYTS